MELEAYLRQRSRDKKAIAVEKNATGLSYMLQGAGFYHLFPSYQFDSGRMEFQALSGCDMLGYIQKKPYITVKDMVAFLPVITATSRNFSTTIAYYGRYIVKREAYGNCSAASWATMQKKTMS